jgi:hypothetical protein
MSSSQRHWPLPSTASLSAYASRRHTVTMQQLADYSSLQQFEWRKHGLLFIYQGHDKGRGSRPSAVSKATDTDTRSFIVRVQTRRILCGGYCKGMRKWNDVRAQLWKIASRCGGASLGSDTTSRLSTLASLVLCRVRLLEDGWKDTEGFHCLSWGFQKFSLLCDSSAEACQFVVMQLVSCHGGVADETNKRKQATLYALCIRLGQTDGDDWTTRLPRPS